jgi:hypothetical protein
MDIYILDGLLICLSESGLMQAMLLNHNLARLHISFVHNNLRDSQIFVLQVRYFNSYLHDLFAEFHIYIDIRILYSGFIQNTRFLTFNIKYAEISNIIRSNKSNITI